MDLMVLLLVSDTLAFGAWGTHLCSEKVRFGYVIAYGVIARAVPRVVFK